MFNRKVCIAGVLSLSLLFNRTAFGDTQVDKADLKTAIKTLATSIQKLLEEEKLESVAVGDFTGPPQIDSNFGPGLKKQLADELKSMKITVSNKAGHTVKGRYAVIDDPKDKNEIAVRLTAEVLNSADDRRGEFKADIRSNTDIAKITAVTTSLPPAGDKESRNEAIKKAQKNPTVAIVNGTMVKTKADSPFGVEVIVKGAALPARDDKGQARVDVKRDDVYEVKVTNNSETDAAVSLNIDGIDVFAFSDVKDEKTGKPRYSVYIVPKGATFNIVGWHKTNEKSLSFLVTEYGKGASTEFKSTGEVGVMTVTFAAAVPTPKDLPKDENAGRGATENETGFGPPKETKLKEVERTIGVLRDVVTIRYTR